MTMVLPPFVPEEYKSAAAIWATRAIRDLSRAIHPVLAELGSEHVADLPIPAEDAGEGGLESPMYRTVKLQHQFTVTYEEILAFDVDTFLSTLYAIADDYGGQMVRSMFEHITQICEDNGQVVNAASRDFYDVLADVLDKIDIDFDNNGRPKLNLAVNPETAQKLSALTPTPEQESRLRQTLQRRQEEWRASRRRHELP